MVTKFGSHTLRVIPGGALEKGAAKLPDEDLLRFVREGTRGAAAAFHDRFRPLVDRVLTRLIGARDPDYDDLAQRALMDLVLSVDRFRGDCPVDGWASVVVARVAYKHIRRRKIERRVFAFEETDVRDIADRNAAQTLSHRVALRRIQKHLDALEPNKAFTYLLHDVHGYELNDISAITGVSPAAAQSRLVRARKELHRRIAEDPELRQVVEEFAPKVPR